jgi:hypothetical protein
MKDSVPTMNLWLGWVVTGLVGGVFVLDLFTPIGVATPLLYAIPLMLTLLSPRRRLFLFVAVAAIVLTIIGFYLSPPGGVPWMGAINRFLAVLAIGVAATFSLLHKRVEARLKSLEALLPFCSSCKRVRDDRGYWKQLELYLEEHAVTHFSRGLCPECLPKEHGTALGMQDARMSSVR